MHDAGALGKVCDDVIAANPQIVADYRAGKERLLMYLIGQVMKEMKGKANPEIVTSLLRDKLRS